MPVSAVSLSKLERMINTVRTKLDGLDENKIAELDKGMDLDAEEHFQYQEMQARAHVEQLLTTEAAMLVYRSLGAVSSGSNGGWAKDTDLATKVVVTQLMGELVSLRLKGKV